jgi:hypothetical protein
MQMEDGNTGIKLVKLQAAQMIPGGSEIGFNTVAVSSGGVPLLRLSIYSSRGTDENGLFSGAWTLSTNARFATRIKCKRL